LNLPGWVVSLRCFLPVIMKKTILFICVLIFGIAISCVAQTCVIKGKVKEDRSSDPVPFANVLIKNGSSGKWGCTTDFDGNFRIEVNPAGRLSVQCSYVGYKLWKKDSVSLRPGDSLVLSITLSMSPMQLQEVQCVGFTAPRIVKSLSYSTATVGGVMSRLAGPLHTVDGIPFMGSGAAGKLTASELNDFSKWDLWQDIRKKELKKFQGMWDIYPVQRYSMQVKNEDGRPVVNAPVRLRNHDGTVLWSARTDNTGKVELWTGMFGKQAVIDPEIVVSAGNSEYVYEDPQQFPKGMSVLKIPVPCDVPNDVDIAFLVDATGSMHDEISFLKSDLIDILQKTNGNMPGQAISLGAVFYRCFENSYVTRNHPLSQDINGTTGFISEQDAGEGGAEAVEEGLRVAIDSLRWNPHARARLLFMILDEQPLVRPGILRQLHASIQKAAEQGIRIIPVVGSAETPENAASMEYLLRSAALATNGTYVFLTDHSHIGDAHSKPVTDQYDVELLNNLLKRIIHSFTWVAACSDDTVSALRADTSTFSNSPVIAHEIIDTTRHVKTGKPGMNVKDFTKVTGKDTTGNQRATDTLTGRYSADTIKPVPAEKIGIKFYPNPTTGRISAEIDGKVKELFLTDISGKLLARYKTAGVSKLEIDLGNFSTGLYFLKFYDHGNWYSGRIVLVRR